MEKDARDMRCKDEEGGEGEGEGECTDVDVVSCRSSEPTNDVLVSTKLVEFLLVCVCFWKIAFVCK
jgi:hypothetical protein